MRRFLAATIAAAALIPAAPAVAGIWTPYSSGTLQDITALDYVGPGDLVYATAGYEQSISNLARTSLATDMVFSDGADRQTPTVDGSVAEGLALALDVPV